MLMVRGSQSGHELRLDSASLPDVAKMVPARRRSDTVVVSTWLRKTRLLSGEGLVIEGRLECDTVHHQHHLMVSRDARVAANMSARTVVVLGQVIGDIVSDGTVLLARGSDVHGNIRSARLYIEEGARFTGRIETLEDATHADVKYS